LAAYDDRAEIFVDYPELEPEDFRQALAFAAGHLDGSIDHLLDAA
jgi:uncharacterized protein (DUF433 family)